MNQIIELITTAEQQGIQLWVEANELCFKAHKGALNAELKTALSEHKADIIAFLQDQQEVPEMIDEYRFPLSYGQQALWFIYQEAPDSPAYNMVFALRIADSVDSTVLQRTLHTVIKRHAQLRTHFEVDVEGKVWQQVTDTITELDIIDASQWTWEHLLEQAYQYSQQPFDLAQSGLRAALFQQASDCHLLVFVLHHICGDARSMDIIKQEWLALYTAEIQEQTTNLPVLPVSYANYVHDEAKNLNGHQGQQLAKYWHQQLAGEVPILNLPTDHPRPHAQTFNGASYNFQLSPTLSAQLTALAQNQKTSLFTLLLGAFQVLLHRYTGQTDIWVGTPTSAGRLQDEFSQLVGYFVNPVVLRSQFTEQSFQQLLTQLHRQVTAALAHQAYPFPHLVQKLQPQRDTGTSPLFQVMFSWHNLNSESEVASTGFSYTSVELPQMESQFDLTLTMTKSTAFGCVLNYKADLFAAKRIERMAQHLTLLLEGIVEQPQQDIHQYPLLTSIERKQLLAWNDTAVDYPKDKTIVDLFEQQVETTPSNIAVVFEEQQLTYRELNSQANQLAHYLQSLGVKPEVLVGICVERSLEMVIGLLGILKAGGAYVPIDPSYPQARIGYMLEDSATPLLLTQSHLKKQLFELEPECVVVCLDEVDFAVQKTENPVVSRFATDLAYVIYTSGSTGKPKGVMIEQRHLVNSTQARIIYYQDKKMKFLLPTSFAFDSSVAGIFASLSAGGELYISRYTNDLTELSKLIRQHRISHLLCVPTLYVALLEYSHDTLHTLNTVIVAGESSNANLIWQHENKTYQARLFNEYGPTEGTVWSSVYQYQKTDDLIDNIGQPIANTRIYILDTQHQIQPPCIPGELCIAGAGLARGYLNRPELTAEKFIEVELFGKTERIYKTGDLARWLPDGNLEYLGRIDNQVKLRGFRIELGEIETVLSQHSAVKEAVVTLYEADDNKRLVAYVTVKSEKLKVKNEESGEPLFTQLKDWLKVRLPDYMVPSHFTVLDKLPLTPNGKIDRKALEKRAANENLALDTVGFVAPRTAEEVLLTNIWMEVLGVERVGIHDNFFELGGHSLLATRLMARIREAFEVGLPLQQLFKAPSVAELNKHIQHIRAQNEQTVAMTLPTIVSDRSARHQPFPLNDIQQAYWLGRNDVFTMGNVAPHIYLELDCPLFEVQRLERAWQLIVERHEMLRAVILPSGQQQIMAQVPPYQFELLDLSNHKAQQAQLADIRQTMVDNVFDVSKWPLFDIRVTQLNAETMRLHLSLDAIISDGWSISIIDREWWQLYQNSTLELRSLTLSFRDYVLAEQTWHSEATYQNALSYWHKRLDNLPPTPQLPLVRQPESLEKPRFIARQFKLNIEQWQALQQKAIKQQVTPSALLLAIFADILALWSKTAHFTLNLTLFNRLPVHEQINQLVGDFTSLILLEIDNHQPTAFSERARLIQKQLWQDLEYRHVSGIHVMRELAARHKDRQSTMPIVFTSMLALDIEPEDSVFNNLGEQVFGLGITPQVWIDHVVIENTEGLELIWNTVDDLFPDGLLDDMFAAYRQYIFQLLNSDDTWQATSIQLPESHLALQHEVNATAVPQSAHFMHTLFIEQVAQQADHPAVINGDVCLSYSELHAASQQLAHWLRQQGAARNQIVAVVMDKGWEQIVAVMGILYAGAAYVPIDPELPEQRQHFLLQETEAQIALTQSKWQDSLNFPQAVQILAVDRHNLPPCDTLPELLDRDLNDLAYIIYTSGSTGNPKGVVINHRGAVNTLVDINRRLQVTAQDRVLALSALNFDLSVYDIFGVLGAGGTLVMPNPTHHRDPQHWAELMIKHQVTLWNTVPALMQMLVDYQNGTPLDTPLRVVMMSGDWIPLTLPERIKQLWPNCQTISLGGATEASIWSIYYPVDTVDHSKNSIPYGKPLDNQTFYVLNEQLEPCPLWTSGYLYIGGIGLAQGYWKDEAKTQARFITHPQTGERLYKTGDLGCWLPDGNIEFLGREDTQVKVRGHRIELGEIETYLNRHPSLKEGIVMAVGEALQEKQLVAYIVPQNASVDEADYGTEAMKGMLTDSVERTAFKLRQPGIRQFADSRQYVALPSVTLNQSTYLARQSYRHFQPMPVPLDALSTLLAGLQPMTLPSAPLPKYRYGSAGSLYPIQCYLYVKPHRITGLEGGLYYYHPLEHRLILLTAEVVIDQTQHGGVNQMIFAESAFSLFLISQMSAIEPMYGQMSRDFCLLEAGYMSQLLMDEAHHHDIGLCPIGGMQFEPIRHCFELSDDQEMLHSFLGGAISLEQKTTLPASETSQVKPEDEIKAFLHNHLPNYMVPNHYVILEKLPLSTNGKVDRKSLPIFDLNQTAKAREAPANETEQQLMEIVISILPVEAVGVTDNFFDIGANSLDFIQIYNAIKNHWGMEISILDLFQLANVREIADLLNIQINAEPDFEEIEL